MRRTKALVLILIISLTFVSISFAKTAPTAKEPVKKSTDAKGETKIEIINDIKEEIDSEEEILNYIPGLKKSRDKETYTYNLNGQDVALENLDKEMAENILTRIYQAATKIRTDRINQQMQTVRNIQHIQELARSQSRTVVTPPRAGSPVAVPPQAPTPPRAPPPPPAPPRR